jgi:hypothetical protein
VSQKEFTMPTTAYGATTTAAEIVADVDLHGRRAIVTGASSGIGIETARALASAGADVTLAVRNVQTGTEVGNGIAENLSPGAGGVQVARLDLADPASVADFVQAWAGPLHILVNNAGLMARRSSSVRLTAMKCSSPQTISVISRWPPAFTRGWPRLLAPVWWLSLRSGTCSRRWSSTTFTIDSVPTTSGLHTASPSQPMCCSRSVPRTAGQTTASRSTRSCPATSPPHRRGRALRA